MKRYLTFGLILGTAVLLRFGLLPILEETHNIWILGFLSAIIILAGTLLVLTKTADIIEETTEVLSERTKLAGGLLQSLGTAFPDMVLGIIAAIISMRYRTTDFGRSINYAIIASATTFGSNIYNIGHAAWCIFRQNLADTKQKVTMMFPGIPAGGTLKPINSHKVIPTIGEVSTAESLLTTLTVLTAFVAICMVIFGKVDSTINPTTGDLYQLLAPVGFVVFLIAIASLWFFRKNMRDTERHTDKIDIEERFYAKQPTYVSLIALAIAGVAILFAAESMVKTIEIFCTATGIPFVIAGVLAGIIGCLGEMLVVHNFSISPKGRIGDAIVGVAMDNIVTILGASIVSIMGGIFLGGNALILIFIIILSLNMVLLWQISKLQRTILMVKR